MQRALKKERTDIRAVVPLSERLSLSPEEASALSGIGVTRLREAIAEGRLVAHKHGTRTIVLPNDLRAWLSALPLAETKDRG